MFDIERLANRTDFICAKAGADFANRQIEILILGGGFGVFHAVGSAFDGNVGARHDAMLGPDHNAMFTQRLDIARHQLRRTRHLERDESDTLGQVDDGLWLPAQEVRVQILLILVARNVAEIRQVEGLAMNNRVKIRFCRAYLVVMDGQVRVEFAGHAFKAAVIRCVQFAGAPAFVDHDTGDIGCRFIDDFAQTAAGTANEEGCAIIPTLIDAVHKWSKQSDFIYSQEYHFFRVIFVLSYPLNTV